MATELDLEGESPRELVLKLKKTNSLHFNEGFSMEAHNHDEEFLHASNLTNVESPDEGEDSDNSLDEHERHVKDKLEETIR